MSMFYTGEIYAFGTPVMHRISGPVQGGVISERWFDGIWIGLQFSSGEHIVALNDGRVIRARAVHPRPETVSTRSYSQSSGRAPSRHAPAAGLVRRSQTSAWLDVWR